MMKTPPQCREREPLARLPVRRRGLLGTMDRYLAENSYRWARGTLRHYSATLYKFGGWLEECGVNDPRDVVVEHLRMWLDRSPHWAPATRFNHLVALRGYFKWAGNTEAQKIALPKKIIQTPRRGLAPDEALKLLAIPDTSTVIGIRNIAILALLIDTGLRAGEVSNVQLQDLRLDELAVHSKTKGGIWNWAIFSEYTALLIHEWKGLRDKIVPAGVDYLFVSFGGPKTGQQLSRWGVGHVVSRTAKLAGMDLCAHELRHTFAQVALLAGAPTRILQKAGRWKSLSMVENYTGRIQLEEFRPYLPMNYLMGDPNG